MNNTRFATAIHILTLLASEPEEWQSSERIAGSIDINPVMVRRELGVLHDAGLVLSKKGKEGGSKLAKESDKILLSEIFLAIKNSEVLGKKNQHTNPQCPIGKQINAKLEELYAETDLQVIRSLERKTLADFTSLFN